MSVRTKAFLIKQGDVRPRAPFRRAASRPRHRFHGRTTAAKVRNQTETQTLSNAPHIDIDVAAFWNDPYPTLARLRQEAPIAFVPQLGSTLLCNRDDISISEKKIDVFSSDQPEGLMTRLMGHNMMRKDGAAHMAERSVFFPAVSPRAVK